MSKLILIRHGQASFGADRYDALSEVGRAQAQATGEWLRLRGELLTRVVHGPRTRQAETAGLLLQASGIPLQCIQQDELDEFAEGEEIFKAAETWLGRSMQPGPERTRRDILQDYDTTCQAWGAGQVSIAGRRSLAEFRRELGTWLHRFTSLNYTGSQQVVVVTSAGVIAALVCEAMELPDPHWTSLLKVVRNASMTEILYTNNRRNLLSFNGVQHLPPHLVTSM